MCRWIESIALRNGRFLNLRYHQNRLNNTLLEHGGKPFLLLDTLLATHKIPQQGYYKVRILYSKDRFLQVDLALYQPKVWKRFELVEATHLNYCFKREDRAALDSLKKEQDVEIIITQNGSITDTTYSNLIFEKDGEWFTPETYLLKGTQRQILLDTHKIKEAKITQCNLTSFSHFKMINAMMTLSESPTYSIDQISKGKRSFIPST